MMVASREDLDRVAVLAAQAESARAVLAAAITGAVDDGLIELPAELSDLVERYRASSAAWTWPRSGAAGSR